MIPSLKAIKALKPKTRREIYTSHSVTSTASTYDEDVNLPRLSSYNDEYKNRGVNICMAKAYAILAANKAAAANRLKSSARAKSVSALEQLAH
jgi:hypothetical protein